MNKKLRLAFFIDNIGFGGAEKSLIALLSRLDYHEVDVDLYTVDVDSNDPAAIAMLPPQVHHLTLPKGRNKLWTRICRLRYSAIIRLAKCLGHDTHWAKPFWKSMKSAYPKLDKDYHAAIAYQQGMITYYVAEKVKARKKIAWVNSLLGAHGHDVKFSRKHYDMFDHVVAVCETQRHALIDTGYVDAAAISTIYDIIDKDEIHANAGEECDIDRGHQWTLVTVARLAPEKNLTLAVDAANILRNNNVDFIWLIIGEGIMEGMLCERIISLGLDSHVMLTGGQKNPYKYMKAADIYVQTSRSEGFGMTIAEAKILGRPVVSTNFPMVYDQIRDEENGLIAEMTAESIASKIMRLISDDSLRQTIMKNLSAEINKTNVTEVKKFLELIHERK